MLLCSYSERVSAIHIKSVTQTSWNVLGNPLGQWFLDEVASIAHWAQTCYVAEAVLELLVFLLPPPEY